MRHSRKFGNEGSLDELYTFLNDLLVEQKFGQVGMPSIESFGSGEIIGAVYDDVMEAVTLVCTGHDGLLEED